MTAIGPYPLDTIVTGDARELTKAIPDKSVDMVFTDPPYHKIHLPLYGWLAQEMPRILKPGAWAFVYGGWLAPEVYNLLCVPGWDYFMTIALVNKAGYPRWWTKKLMIGFKPVYVFTAGTPTIQKWQSNIADSDSADKRYHAWGQGTGLAIEKIDMFTQPGAIVFDPFCGGGQVAAACKETGRHYLTFEKDPDTAATARARLANTQPPLFTLQPQQLTMGGL